MVTCRPVRQQDPRRRAREEPQRDSNTRPSIQTHAHLKTLCPDWGGEIGKGYYEQGRLLDSKTNPEGVEADL